MFNSILVAYVKNILWRLLCLLFEHYVEPRLRFKLKVLYDVFLARLRTKLLVTKRLWVDENGRCLPMVGRLVAEVVVLNVFLLLCGYVFSVEFGDVDTSSIEVLPVMVSPSPTMPVSVFYSPVATSTSVAVFDDEDEDVYIYLPIFDGGF